MMAVDYTHKYVFPAIRGIQARHEYYVSMCPLRLIPKLFVFDDDEIGPELRAQRVLNKSRLPEIANYILGNRESYTFSALTASIDSDVKFEPFAQQGEGKNLGLLHIPMSARFIINDGQHRRASIEIALKENPELGDETIAVVFFLDIGLERCQQMFADLNRYAIRPTKSIGVLYDHRDDVARLTKLVVLRSTFFADLVDKEHSTLSLKSRKLFTLSAIYNATLSLLENHEFESDNERVEVVCGFWEEVAKQFPEWDLVRQGKMLAREVRADFLHSHGIALQAIGRVGNILLSDRKRWRRELAKLKQIDWTRGNAGLWEGRAMLGGRVSKANINVILTTNVLKEKLGIPLAENEQRIEDAFLRGDNGRATTGTKVRFRRAGI
jgi:DNA sulfur modification protein DndB